MGGRELASPFMETSLKSHTTLPLTSHWLDLSTGSHLLPRRLGHRGAVDLSLRLRGDWVLGRQVASVPMAPSNKGEVLPLLITALQTWAQKGRK